MKPTRAQIAHARHMTLFVNTAARSSIPWAELAKQFGFSTAKAARAEFTKYTPIVKAFRKKS